MNNSSFLPFIPAAPHLILCAPRGHLSCRTTTLSCMQRYNRREKCCLYPPTDLSRGKTFFPSERRESNIPFIIVITPLIVFVTESHEMNFSCFRVLSTSNTSTSYKSLSVLHFRSTFFICFCGADRILPQNAVEDMIFASDNSPCLFIT